MSARTRKATARVRRINGVCANDRTPLSRWFVSERTGTLVGHCPVCWGTTYTERGSDAVKDFAVDGVPPPRTRPLGVL